MTDRTAVDVAAESLHVRRWGDAGDPVLFLHSLGPASSAAFFGLGAAPLVDAGYEVAGPDLPGFGGSPPLTDSDRYDVDAMAELGWAVADLLDWERLVLIGHSWGGAIACHAAAQQPDRVEALVLVDSGHLDYATAPGADLEASLDELAEQSEQARLRLPDRAAVADLIEVDVDDVLVDAFLEGMVEADGGLVSATPGIARGAALWHLTRAKQSATWPVIASNGIPTLLLLATEPEGAREINEEGAAAFSAALPQADVRFVPGATHSLITDERDRFGATVAEWLATVRSG
jgi:pimeloyl-ACP methyl ester carboxylesterase